MTAVTNWAGNVRFGAARLERPESMDELVELVAAATRLKAVGSGYSFSTVADTTGLMLRLDRLVRGVEVDERAGTATVDAGATLALVAAQLDGSGLALAVMPSLPHITVAGAVTTGTHGSGDMVGALSSAVVSVEIVTPDGQVRELSRGATGPGGGDSFDGVPCAMGALGVITRVTLAVEPTYEVEQRVFTGLPLQRFLDDPGAVLASASSVSVFFDLRDDTAHEVWLKNRLDDDRRLDHADGLFEAPPATRQMHPVRGADARACTVQGGVPGPWHERLPHFRADALPSSRGYELQSEYLVPRVSAPDAVEALLRLRGSLSPLVQVCEVRSIAADDLWLSPCWGRDSVGLHVTWLPEPAAVAAVLPLLERALEPLQARPHWGKAFATSPARLAELYPRLPDFRALAAELDPQGRCRNTFLDVVLGA